MVRNIAVDLSLRVAGLPRNAPQIKAFAGRLDQPSDARGGGGAATEGVIYPAEGAVKRSSPGGRVQSSPRRARVRVVPSCRKRTAPPRKRRTPAMGDEYLRRFLGSA